MTYRVSFETETVDTDTLPAGAKVERKFPVEVLGHSNRKITVNNSRGGPKDAHLTVKNTREWGYQEEVRVELPENSARELILALQEVIGDRVIEVPAPVEPELEPFTAFRKDFQTPYGSSRTVRVEQSGILPGGVFLSLSSDQDNVGGSMSTDDARELASALLRAVGDEKAIKVGDVLDEDPPNYVTEIADSTGDVFYRVKDNGSDSYYNAWRLGSPDGLAGWSWDEIESYSPVTVRKVA